MAMPIARHNSFMVPSIFAPNPNPSNNGPYRRLLLDPPLLFMRLRRYRLHLFPRNALRLTA